MAAPASELDHPVRGAWLAKALIQTLPVFLWFCVITVMEQREPRHAAVILLFPGLVVCAVAGFSLGTAWLRRATFHFSVDEKFLTVRQGIIKKQEKHLPYGVIQHIILKQGLLDRMLGLTTLALENASRGPGTEAGTQKAFGITFKTP
ncbi:MAG TPA: PH domain-containing protein, partial [bacterium]|nr:PH domain-containing protein [bacterium]